MKLVTATTMGGDKDDGINIGIFFDKRMPELQEMAAILSERIGQRVNFAQAFNLFLGALDDGAIEAVDGLWTGSYIDPDVIDAIMACLEDVPPEELRAFTTHPDYRQCEQEYQEWKSRQPQGDTDKTDRANKTTAGPKEGSDGLNFLPHGVAMSIWYGNIPNWEKLARRLSWRLKRDINYVQACFLFWSAKHDGAIESTGTSWSGCVCDRTTADAIESHLRILGSVFLDELLSAQEFTEWEQQYLRVKRRGTVPASHQQMVLKSSLALYYLVLSEAERREHLSGMPVAAAADAPVPTADQSPPPVNVPQDCIEVHYSSKRDIVALEEWHVPHWQKLARALSEGLRRKLNFAHACSMFGWALRAGDLSCIDGRWYGCVHSPEVVNILLEYATMAGPDALARLLVSNVHKRIAREYKAKRRLAVRRGR